MRILLTAATALPLLLTSIGFIALPTTPTLALPSHSSCLITTYYNNASFDEEVGTRTQCTGSPVKMTGRTTPWHTAERVDLETSGGHTSGGPGSLPCEFLAAGCSNLPTNRFN